VPAVTIVIDTPERIAGAYEVIDELTSERGLVTCETIRCLDEAGLPATLVACGTRVAPGSVAASRYSAAASGMIVSLIPV
jgi:hypothetical protein